MEQDHKYGIQILYFDRQDYLEPVLEGIKKQTYTNFDIHLFNDGPKSWEEDAQLYHSNVHNIELCCDLFKKFFPD